MKPVTLLSHIADHDFLNQTSTESAIFFHDFNSSLILSKINIFASIAIPIDNISHAIDARVKTVQNTFTTVRTSITYINRETEAIKPDNL